MLLCFLDESGGHILSGGDPNYPVFVLAGVVEVLSEERGARAKIIAESRSSSLDQRLKRTWEGLLEKGTHYVRAQRLRRRVEGLIFKKKGDNEAGLQLADLAEEKGDRLELTLEGGEKAQGSPQGRAFSSPRPLPPGA
jgi:hypothetical protein